MRLTAEAAEQIAIFDWIRLNPSISRVSFHPVNEGRRNIATGRILKRMGMRSGVPDIIILKPSGPYHGLLIELKAKNAEGKFGKATPNQLAFLKDTGDEGYFACVCEGADQAIEVIKLYLKQKKGFL